MNQKQKLINTGIGLLVLLNLIITLFLNESTYDDGDSILHYLQSKNSFRDPSLFMNHWAKPVFVLLSAPFTQMGFMGMKLFNVLCISLAIFFTWKIAKIRLLKFPWFVWVMAFFAPHVFLIQSSGMTEPLFAFFVALIAYLYLKEYWITSAVLISFLPFVRSEGWILGIVFLILLAYEHRWKIMPYLFSGSLLYGILGSIVHKDFLWMINKNPYQGVSQEYGSGPLFHYVEQIPYMFGWPLTIFLIIGIVAFLVRWLRRIVKIEAYHFLVLGMGLALLVSHSIFWSQGWFRSNGMHRVLISVLPCFLLVAQEGLDRVMRWPRSLPLKRLILCVVSAVFVWFPFSKNPAGLELPEDIQKSVRLETIELASNWYSKEYKNDPRYFGVGHYYFLETLDLPLGDVDRYVDIHWLLQYEFKKGDILLWDDAIAVNYMQVPLELLMNEKYKVLKEFKGERDKHKARVIIFEKQ